MVKYKQIFKDLLAFIIISLFVNTVIGIVIGIIDAVAFLSFDFILIADCPENILKIGMLAIKTLSLTSTGLIFYRYYTQKRFKRKNYLFPFNAKLILLLIVSLTIILFSNVLVTSKEQTSVLTAYSIVGIVMINMCVTSMLVISSIVILKEQIKKCKIEFLSGMDKIIFIFICLLIAIITSFLFKFSIGLFLNFQ